VSPSLIDELQIDATGSAVSVSALLRKALLVAAKLEVPDLPNWIDRELSGYAPDDALPPYRLVRGLVKGRVMGRWIAVQYSSNEMETEIAVRRIDGSVADIEGLLSREGSLKISFSAEAQRVLQGLFSEPRAEFVSFVDQARLVAILDEIRNRVLRWAIALDKAGVRGEGLSFSTSEKEKAHSIVLQQTGGSVTIGVLGDVSGSANVATGYQAKAGGIDPAELQQLLAQIRDPISSLNLAPADKANLQSALADLHADDVSKRPDPSRVREALRQILSNVGKAGYSVLTAGLNAYIEHWMKQHGLAS
jgi:hypothetical protein